MICRRKPDMPGFGLWLALGYSSQFLLAPKLSRFFAQLVIKNLRFRKQKLRAILPAGHSK